MKISKLKNGRKESEFDYAIDVPVHISEYVRDTVPYIISEAEAKILDGEESFEKLFLIYKLRKIIENDYENFLLYLQETSPFIVYSYFPHILLQQYEKVIPIIKHLHNRFSECNELINKHEVFNDYKNINLKHTERDNIRHDLHVQVTKLEYCIHNLMNFFPDELLIHIDDISSFTFSNDSFISKMGKILRLIHPEHRAYLYFIINANEFIRQTNDIVDKQINYHNNTSPSFLVKTKIRNGKLQWIVQLNNQELVSLVVSANNNQESIVLLRNILENGYDECITSNLANAEKDIILEVGSFFESGNITREKWEKFYFHQRDVLISDSLKNVEKLDHSILKEVPIGQYIVLLKNDDLHKLYSFNDQIVIDLLTIADEDINSIDYSRFYEKFHEFNFIKKEIGIVQKNNITITSEQTFDSEKKSETRDEAIRCIMFFLKPILNEKFIVKQYNVDTVRDLLREIFLSEKIGNNILCGVKHCQCFNLKLVFQVLGILLDPEELKGQNHNSKINRISTQVFTANPFHLVSYLQTYHKLKFNSNNFSKHIRDVDDNLPNDIIVEIQRLHKKHIK